MSVNSSHVELSWKLPEPYNRNGIIRYFVVNITNLQNNEMLLNSTSTQFVATDLLPYSTYFFSVAAVTTAMGPYSKTISTTTLQDGMFRLVLIMMARMSFLHFNTFYILICNIFSWNQLLNS